MEASFWVERWKAGQTGFHQDSPTPYLVAHEARLAGAGKRALVPLCGKSNDLAWLAGKGYQVVGVEVVELAVKAFFEERGLSPERAPAGKLERFSGAGVTLLCGDFFDVSPETAGTFDVAFDRAALVALPPDVRPRYVRHLRSLLRPGGQILLITFAYDQTKMDGPPFSVTEDEVRALYEGCEIERVEHRDVMDENPRFRERGLDAILEGAFAITLSQ